MLYNRSVYMSKGVHSDMMECLMHSLQSNVQWEESDEGNLTIMQYLTCTSVGQKVC